LNPYDEELAAFRHRAAVSLDCESDDTHYLELTPGFDAVHGKFKKNSAWGIRKAQAAGVRVRTAKSKEDWIAYYAIYQDSLQRWGDRASSRYQFEIFEEMFDRQSPHIQLWLAIYSDEIVAGAVCFYSKRHVVYWHGAALSSHFNVQPVNLLMHDIIQHACQLGYRWFDFNPSGGHQGVRAFKSSFGASPRDASVVIRRSTARKMSEWAASSLARRP
jgi:lipid II:glycine glycyltransferase (peptidoglycan interpeptide bridge formation enzyme)